MWVLPVDRTTLPRAALPPGRYLLPWYWTGDEVRRSAELLAAVLEGVARHAVVPWTAIESLRRAPIPRAESTALVVRVAAPEPEDPGVDEVLAQVQCRYVFIQLPSARELGYGWQEQHIKPVVRAAISRELRDPDHPLAALNVRAVPVLTAATLTPDVLELVDLVEAAVAHRLRHAAQGLGDADYLRSLLLEAGRRLVRRLMRLPIEELQPALEVLLAEGEIAAGDGRHTAGSKALDAIGLARVVGGDMSMGPLGRHIREAEIQGALLDGLPRGAWTPRARELLGAMRRGAPESTPPVAMPAARAALPSPVSFLAAVHEEHARELLDAASELVHAVAGVTDSVDELPQPLRKDLVKMVQHLRRAEKDEPASAAAFRLMTAMLQLAAARGAAQLNDREEALARVEEYAERSDPALARAVLVMARLWVAQTLILRQRELRDLDRAEELLDATMRLLTPGSPQISVVYAAKGRIAEEREDDAAAMRWYERSLDILEAQGPTPNLAEVYLRLGSLARRRRDYAEALRALRASLRVLRRVHHPGGRSAVYEQLGILARERGALARAAAWQRRALQISQDLGDSAGIAVAWMELGTIALARGREDGAVDHYQRALHVAERAGLHTLVAQIATQLGDMAERHGNVDVAIETYRRVLERAEQLGLRLLQRDLLRRLKHIADKRGAEEEARELSDRLQALESAE